MDITVLVCTYNRCELLRAALDSIAASRLAEGTEWEVLVVDNNSADATPEVVRAVASRYPGLFRYIREPQQGKSFALNRGIREARGEILAFTDDDVTVERDWLARLTSVLIADPSWAGSGGSVVALWPGPKPRWLGELDRRMGDGWDGISVSYRQSALERELGQLIGANMALRKSVVQRLGGFRTDVGPKGSGPGVCDDTEMFQRLTAEGHRLAYVHEAVVLHPVPPNRTTKEYALAWYYAKGRGDALIAPPNGAIAAAGVPLHLFRRLIACGVRWLASPGSQKRFFWRTNAWYVAGMIRGHRERVLREHALGHVAAGGAREATE